MYKCNLCNKTFEYKAYLERHKNNKKPCNKPKQLYNCELCKSNFEHKSHLDIHNKTKKHITNIPNDFNNTPSAEDELKLRLQQEYENKLKIALELKENEIKSLLKRQNMSVIQLNKLQKENELLKYQIKDINTFT